MGVQKVPSKMSTPYKLLAGWKFLPSPPPVFGLIGVCDSFCTCSIVANRSDVTSSLLIRNCSNKPQRKSYIVLAPLLPQV